MNGLTLKCIALVTMLIDHIGAIFFPQYMWLRMIGRIAFPIYCFLLVEGYFHTKNVKKYLCRLCAFALLSEIPFRLAFYNDVTHHSSNVFFTLFLGLLAMYICDSVKLQYPKLQAAGYGAFVIVSAIAVWMNTDYDYRGIILIFIFYMFGNSKVTQLGLSALLFGMMSSVQLYGVLAFIPIFVYNGRRGPNHKALSMAFYLFYPVHLLVLYAIGCLI